MSQRSSAVVALSRSLRLARGRSQRVARNRTVRQARVHGSTSKARDEASAADCTSAPAAAAVVPVPVRTVPRGGLLPCLPRRLLSIRTTPAVGCQRREPWPWYSSSPAPTQAGVKIGSGWPSAITITATQENQKPVPRTSLPDLPPSMNIDPTDISRDQHSLSPTLPDGIIVEAPESGSELDSPPHLTFTDIEKDPEPSAPTSPSWPPTFPSGSPTSPPGSPPLVNVNPTRLPNYSSSDEALVDNFFTATANTLNSTLSDDDIDYKAQAQQKCVLFAQSALKHYNDDEKKEVKYELISGIACSDILDDKGCFSHVNFTAKGNQHNSKEELFFAELRWNGDTPVTTCVVSLEGEGHTGGLRGSKYDKFYLDVLPFDAKNCYCCNRPIRHPKNGMLYEVGHVAMSQYYI